MQKSLFTIEMNINDRLVLYNTFSSGILSLDKEYKERYEKLSNFSFKSGIYDDLKRELIKGNMIVSKEDDEIAKLNLINNLSRFKNDVLSLTIAPTMECNFACIYCYEKGHRNKSMDKKILDQTIRFINNNLFNKKGLGITWYGGEPLLAIDEMEYIYENVKKNFCENFSYSSGIVTNGYLLDREMAIRLNNLNVEHVQITLDGDRENHDTRRFMVDGQKTYDVIVNNIKEIYDIINISVRINVDHTNKNSINSIFNSLGKEVYEKINIYIAPVDNINDTFVNARCIQKQEFAELDIKFDKVLQAKGKDKNMPGMAISGCGANMYNSFIIHPSGNLYKCWNHMGQEDKVVGNVYGELFINEIFSRFVLEENIDEECRTCNIIPLCYGGCSDHRIRNRDMNNRCQSHKFNIEKQLKIFVENKLKLNK